jgi:hypothetical protein
MRVADAPLIAPYALFSAVRQFAFQTATASRSRGAMRPRFANSSRDLREGMERWEAPGVLR